MRERAKQAAQKAASGGASYIKLPEGIKVNFFSAKVTPDGQEYELDFLPYEVTVANHPDGILPGELWFKKDIKVHYGIGADDKSYICLRTIGEACPICEAQKLLAKDASVSAADAKALLAKDRTIFQLIDLKAEDKGIQLWDISYHLFTKKLLQDINKTENSQTTRRRTTPHAGFAELDAGQTLFVSFQEKTMPGSKPFPDCDRIDAEDRAPYEENILDEVLDLDSIIEVKTYEELENIFLSGGAAPAEEPHHEAPAATGRAAGGTRGTAAAPAEEPAAPAGRAARGTRGAAPAQEPEPAPATSGRAARGTRGAAAPAEEPAQTAGRTGRGTRGTPAAEPAPAATSSRTTRGARGAAAEPAPAAAPAGRTRAAAPANPCPYNFRYGVDCELKDECIDSCPEETWAACKAIKEGGQ
jgi:hypothetical protein